MIVSYLFNLFMNYERERMIGIRFTRLLQALFIAGIVFLVYQMYYLGQLQTEVPRRRRPPLAPAPRSPSEVPLGVAPQWANFYWHEGGPDHFQCGGRENHGKLLSWTKVNDNFCDCGAGVEVHDEPATGACAETHFVCTKEPTISVPSSRVNDGICDCCDGSDESANVSVPNFAKIPMRQQERLRTFQAPCVDRC